MKVPEIILGLACLAALSACRAIAPATPPAPVEIKLESGDLEARIDPADGRVLALTGSMGGTEPLSFLLDADKLPAARLGTIQLALQGAAEGVWKDLRLPGAPARFQLRQVDGASEARWKLEDFPLEVISRFVPEEGGRLGWEIEIANLGPTPLTIGELGFPFPANTDYYSGFDQSDEGLGRLFATRVYQHRHIGGRASYLVCRRLNGQFPALALTCGSNPGLEFTYMEGTDWEGVPVLLAASQATSQRLKLAEPWLNGHTAIVLQPAGRQVHRFDLRLIQGRPHYQGSSDVLDAALIRAVAASGGVAIEPVPGMVVPAGESWLVGVTSATGISSAATEPPVSFGRPLGARQPYLEARFDRPGPARLLIETEGGGRNAYHLRVIESPRELIRRRARFVAANQVLHDPASPLDGAILVWDRQAGRPLVDPNSYWGGGGYEGGICDAMFLAEKNARIPDPGEIQVLEEYVDRFLLGRLQNPGTGEVAWFFPGGLTPFQIGRPYNYAHVAGFHHAMYEVARLHGLTRRPAREYLQLAARTVEAMLDRSWRWHLTHVGLMGAQVLYGLPAELRAEGLAGDADRLERALRWRAEELLSRDWPYSAEPLFDTTGYEEIYFAGKFLARFDSMARTLECAMTQKSFTPTWFWNGSDKRYWDAMEPNPGRGYYGTDMGETCFHYTATLTAQAGLDDYTHPRFFREDAVLARSYAGLLGVLTLIHPDGSASMAYTPDPGSNHYGFNRYSGDVGLGLTGLLRASTAIVRDLKVAGGETVPVGYGCRVGPPGEAAIEVEPWDPVQQRVQWPGLEYDVTVDRGRIVRAVLSRSKRSVQVELENDTVVDRPSELIVRGLWGNEAAVGLDGQPAGSRAPIRLDGCRVAVPIRPGARRLVTLAAE